MQAMSELDKLSGKYRQAVIELDKLSSTYKVPL